MVLQLLLLPQIWFKCIVYMGQEDVIGEKLNVFKMSLMGSEIRAVKSGSATLKDATNEAIRTGLLMLKIHFMLLVQQ